jgi:hypothetical protein
MTTFPSNHRVVVTKTLYPEKTEMFTMWPFDSKCMLNPDSEKNVLRFIPKQNLYKKCEFLKVILKLKDAFT